MREAETIQRRWYTQAVTGKQTGLWDALAELAEGDSAARAWALASRAAYWHADPSAADLVTPAEIAACAGAPADAVARAAAHVMRAHLLSGDPERAEEALAAATAAGVAPEHTAVALERWFVHLSTGRGAPNVSLESLEQDARKREDAPAAIDAAALRALGEQALVDAVALGRRASRMAQVESYPQSSYLAGWVLARLRRLTGHPHLALRLLGALSRFASCQFRGLISWELLLAGEAERQGELEALPAPRGVVEHGFESAALVAHALSAAAEGDRDRYEASMAALSVGTGPYRWLSGDLSCLRSLLSVRGQASEEAAPFTGGSVDAIPRGLSNLAPADASTDAPPALVVVRPSGARRLLHLGLPLLRAEEPGLRIYDDPHERIDSIIACLALHDGWIGERELFERVYGFAYRPRIHSGSFRVNLHRVRSRLEDCATVASGDEGVALSAKVPFALFDPRTSGTADDLLLHAVAVEGSMTAKAAARATGLPLRTVQRNLRGLVDAGLCERQRRGNEVLYLVEDTTFSEPTRH